MSGASMVTMLRADALKRDLARYADSVDAADRQRIMERMIDTVRTEMGDHVNVGEIIAQMINLTGGDIVHQIAWIMGGGDE